MYVLVVCYQIEWDFVKNEAICIKIYYLWPSFDYLKRVVYQIDLENLRWRRFLTKLKVIYETIWTNNNRHNLNLAQNFGRFEKLRDNSRTFSSDVRTLFGFLPWTVVRMLLKRMTSACVADTMRWIYLCFLAFSMHVLQSTVVYLSQRDHLSWTSWSEETLGNTFAYKVTYFDARWRVTTCYKKVWRVPTKTRDRRDVKNLDGVIEWNSQSIAFQEL